MFMNRPTTSGEKMLTYSIADIDVEGDFVVTESMDPVVEESSQLDSIGGVLMNEDIISKKDMLLESESSRRYRMIRREPAKTFFCRECNKAIKYPSKIAEHMRKHTGERPFKCDFCNAQFTQGHSLQAHMRIHGNLRPYKCSFCDDLFKTTTMRKEHERSHLQANEQEDESEIILNDGDELEQYYACPVYNCEMKSFDKHEVEIHIAAAHADAVFEEDVVEEGEVLVTDCEPIIDDDPQLPLKDEFEQFEMKQVILQPNDGHEAISKNDLLPSQSLPRIKEEEVFFLPHEHFADVPRPTEEVEVVTSAQPSDDIYFAYPSVHHVEQESAIYVEESPPVFSMNDDDGGGERIQVLVDPRPPKSGRRHEFEEAFARMHPQIMELDASLLEMVAPTNHLREFRGTRRPKKPKVPARNLDWIIDAVAKGVDVDFASPHNRRKPMVHVCEYCGKVDKYPSKIMAHMRTHTGEKPYKCEICGMAFAQRTPMRLHMRRHLDQKPYVCMIEGCEQRFVSGALLNIHQQIKHLNKRKFVCMRGCGRCFTSRRNQVRHEEKCAHQNENGEGSSYIEYDEDDQEDDDSQFHEPPPDIE